MKGKSLIIIILLVTAMVVGGMIYTFTPEEAATYTAVSSVRIDAPQVRSDGSGGAQVSVPDIEGQMKVLTSMPVILRTAQKMNLLPAGMTEKEAVQSVEAASVISDLTSMISVQRYLSSDIIEIHTVADEPEEARALANNISEAFAEYFDAVSSRNTHQTANFIKSQLEQYELQLAQTEGELEDFHRSNKSDVCISADKITDLQDELADIQKRMVNISSQISQLEKRMESSTENRIDWISDKNDDPALTILNKKLINLQLEQEEHLVHQYSTSPDVVYLEKQIRKIVSDIKKEMEGNLSELSHRESDLKKKIASFPMNLYEYSKFNRDLKLNEDIYSMLLTKYEETRIKSAETSSGVSIVGYALTAEKVESGGDIRQAGIGAALWIFLCLFVGYTSRQAERFVIKVVSAISGLRSQTALTPANSAKVKPVTSLAPEVSPDQVERPVPAVYTADDILAEALRLIETVEYDEDNSGIQNISGEGAEIPYDEGGILKCPNIDDFHLVRPPVKISGSNNPEMPKSLIRVSMPELEIDGSRDTASKCSISDINRKYSNESGRGSLLGRIKSAVKHIISNIVSSLTDILFNDEGEKRHTSKMQNKLTMREDINSSTTNIANIGADSKEVFNNTWENRGLSFCMEDVREKISFDAPETIGYDFQADMVNDRLQATDYQNSTINFKPLENNTDIILTAEKIIENFKKQEDGKMEQILSADIINYTAVELTENFDRAELYGDNLKRCDYSGVSNHNKLKIDACNPKILDSY